jgi:molybdopterin synthase catalytic subunit
MFKLQREPLNLEVVVNAVGASTLEGAVVTFTGVVRSVSRGKRVTRLEYEAYDAMAEKQLSRIGNEVTQQWPGARAAVVHRVGSLAPGELAVVIAVAAPHRAEAFDACRHVIERLKQDVPIWKKEFSEDGDVWVGVGS